MEGSFSSASTGAAWGSSAASSGVSVCRITGLFSSSMAASEFSSDSASTTGRSSSSGVGRGSVSSALPETSGSPVSSAAVSAGAAVTVPDTAVSAASASAPDAAVFSCSTVPLCAASSEEAAAFCGRSLQGFSDSAARVTGSTVSPAGCSRSRSAVPAPPTEIASAIARTAAARPQ